MPHYGERVRKSWIEVVKKDIQFKFILPFLHAYVYTAHVM
jgi:hypothetical protein